jgi:Ca2+-transporting ATPase
MEQIYQGLNEKQVLESRTQHGSNLLTPPPKEPLWKLYLEKLEDPIIRILLIAVCLSLVVSFIHNDYSETIGIFCAIILATGIGFGFEVDANKKFELLNQINDDTPVKTIRNGNICEIPKKDIVTGDIVLLETGDEIPADGILSESVSLNVNESTLTGEPSIFKTTCESDFQKDATYPSNRLYRGTTIIEGHCVLRITNVGDKTEFGQVAKESTIESEVDTPLNKQLNQLAKVISKVAYVVAGLTFLSLFCKDLLLEPQIYTQGDWLNIAEHFLNYFMIAITLIVVAVPEGLPMSVSLSLALSMRKMLKTNNLVRKMHACETMGAVTVICTDKTGTLTQNQMQVIDTYFCGLDNQKLADDMVSCLIKEGISANSTAFLDFSNPEKVKTLGNPTEAALLLWLNKHKINYRELRNNAVIIGQLAFNTERKYMASLVDSPLTGKRILYVKGAPEIVFSKCSKTQISAEALENKLNDYQTQAMRTLGFAYLEVDKNETPDIKKLVDSGLTFLGITAISDPIREDVPSAVAACISAGIKVVIVTGDTPGTAREIGRQIGVWTENDIDRNFISGSEFAKLSDEEAIERVKELKIMCRARPNDKLRLVQLLQKCGEVVAVTGDGTNDAPALNFSQVGLSMGSGTSVAKEASDITLLDDSFQSIATAVMWGRSLYKNIQRFLLFQLTINFVALTIVLLGSLFGRELPLTVTQMLWVNLIMDTFAAAALASLPPNSSVMRDKPRRNSDFIISKKMAKNILSTGTGFIVFLLGLLYYFTYWDKEISIYELSCFFTVFVFLQFWNLFNAKAFDTGKSTFYNMRYAGGFLVVSALILIGQYLIVTFGGEAFRTEPITWQDWLTIFFGTSAIFIVREVFGLLKCK